ncbi:hypothetical protein JYT76_00115 [Olleya sp. AH-315-F22]|nr:hypothetical protein [Olleya sp. AH-315-F22]
MNITNIIKHYIVKSPLHKTAKNIEARILSTKMVFSGSEIVNHKTVYCISPFKTGTTYLSSCFNPEMSKHEPIHYLSYKNLDKDFDSFFIKRLNYLNLKLECSGHWSAYINELAHNEIAKDLDYICILRSPSSWVTSVINHWHMLCKKKHSFNFANELFWKQKVGVDLFAFKIGIESKKNQEIIEGLIRFYFDFTKNTSLLNNITYIKLKEIDKDLPLVESLIHEDSTNNKRWKREAKEKYFVYENKSIDMEYDRLTSRLIKENKSLITTN